jgi:hypothetical protein
MQRLPLCVEYSPSKFSKIARVHLVDILTSMNAVEKDPRTTSLAINECRVFVFETDILWALDEYQKKEDRVTKEWKV